VTEHPYTRDELISAYLDYGRTQDDRYFWAFNAVLKLILEEEYEDLWSVSLALIAAVPDDDPQLLAYVAAGPLEDVIRRAGPQILDRLETQARRDRKFRRSLTGVWGHAQQPEVWARLQPLVRSVPDPL